LRDLPVHFGPAQQVEVIHAAAYPLPRWRKRQAPLRLCVMSERTGEWHQAVAQQTITPIPHSSPVVAAAA